MTARLPDLDAAAYRLEPLKLPDGRGRFFIPGQIVAWARADRGQGRTFTPAAQAKFAAVVQQLGVLMMAGQAPLEGPVGLRVVGTFSWPSSDRLRRRAVAETWWKTTRPDIDNACVKLVADALEGIAWRNDAQIARLEAFKLLGLKPGLEVTITPLLDAPPAHVVPP